ncbi:MAG: DUF1361 domain-containing protein [Caldilineae bacterium]|nr:DUF1361 domain-containing protein [Caldilineae bacterium]
MTETRSTFATFARLTLAAAFPVALVIARSLYAREITATFLIWNLFLAWLPLLFAALAIWVERRSLLLAILPTAAWLAFLPNAPYLVTDLMHLAADSRVPVLFDTVMLFTFALYGLALGLVSLRWMQSAVARRWGRWLGWGFVLGTLGGRLRHLPGPLRALEQLGSGHAAGAVAARCAGAAGQPDPALAHGP